MIPEAIKNPLVGGHLIEASAGTGKTWTLTGILLRLLIERQIKPERIIATTFTKKAAAEMQERIRQRLMDFYDACIWCKEHQLVLSGLDQQSREQKLLAGSKTLGALADPINIHLLLWLLDEPANQLDITLYRVRALLASLHKLYIGTLDSFAHKLLKDNSIISANIHQRQVMADGDVADVVKILIQDRLRYNHAWLKNNLIYPLIDKKALSDVAQMQKHIKNALHFFGAPIDAVTLPNAEPLIVLHQTLKTCDHESFLAYADDNYRQQVGLKKSSRLYKNIDQLPTVLQVLKDAGTDELGEILSAHATLLGELDSERIAGAFKKEGFETQSDKLQQLENRATGKLFMLYEQCQALGEQFLSWLLYDVAIYVRSQLPQVLAEQNATTHTLKTQELLKALGGRQGRQLARQIFHQYPVALIDEVQDVSGEQADLIEAIYLRSDHLNYLKDKGFLLLVGDPKQAIYRFRGGDVANYNRLRTHMSKLGLSTNATLTVNRRSNQNLINALNAWFEKEYSQLGEGIEYQPISGVKDGQGLVAEGDNHPISLLTVSDDDPKTIASHIKTLLNNKVTIDDGAQRRAITPSDIAILVNNNDHIAPLSGALKEMGIESSSSQAVNVFGGRAASDLYHLLLAATNPSDTHKIGVLTGLFFCDLGQATELLGEQVSHSEFNLYLKRLNRLWQKKGLLYALGEAFSQPIAFLENQPTLWQYWAGFSDGERYLADMWQLYELVGAWQMPQPLLLQHFIRQTQKPSDRHERVSLPATQTVTIITVHKSKGLEFNVVYVLGIDRTEPKKIQGLLSYVGDNGRRQLSPLTNQYKTLYQNEDMAESKRLGYVALTRAAQKIYVVAKDRTRKQNSVLCDWGLFAGDNGNTLSVPVRLAPYMYQSTAVTVSGALCVTTPTSSASEQQTVDDWSCVLKNTCFVAEQSTSFTEMKKLLSTDLVVLDGKDDEPFADMVTDEDIRRRFMRGKTAGTFLHQALQMIDGDDTAQILQKNAKKMGLTFDETTFAELSDWLDGVGREPFLASGVALYDITHKITELPFSLGLSGRFCLADMTELLARFGIILNQNTAHNTFFYLNGEIDLLYEYQGKYYVVDYKSNTLNDYGTESMTKAMDAYGYWLQALIYQVALHRLLALKFADYRGRERAYLGAVEYVFLRGINGTQQGRLLWQIPLELLLAMDELLG